MNAGATHNFWECALPSDLLESPTMSEQGSLDNEARKMLAARRELYSCLSTITDGKIKAPEDLSKVTGLRIMACYGWSLPLKRERNIDIIQKIGISDPSQIESATNRFREVFSRIPSDRNVPENWKSPQTIVDERKHAYIQIQRRYVAQRRIYIDQKTEDGMTPEDAEIWVEKNRIGTYRPYPKRSGLYASPEAVEEMNIADNKKVPLAPKKWNSVSKLCTKYGHSDSWFYAQLEELRQKYMSERMADGVPQQQAEEWVEKKRFGTYKHKKGEVTIYVSPRAETDLNLPNNKNVPIAPEGWRSLRELSKEYHYDYTPLKIQIQRLRKVYIKETMNQGATAIDAERYVEENLIGTYRNAIKGISTIYVSPQAVDDLYELGTLIRRRPGASASVITRERTGRGREE